MNNHFRIVLTLAVAAFPFIAAPAANAGLMFVFDKSNYEVAPGATVDVGVSLVQDGINDTILTDEGLLSAGVRVFFNGSPIPIDPAVVASLSDISANTTIFDDLLLPAFTDLDPGVSAGLSETVDLFSLPAVGNSIFLGTFRFTAGTIAGEVTQLRATIFDAFLDTTVTAGFVAIDSTIEDGFATITVNSSTAAVPEPSSWFLAVVGIPALFYLRKWKLR